MNRRNINWLKRNLYEMIDPNNANAGGGSQLDPTTHDRWDERGLTPGYTPPKGRPSWNPWNSPPSQYGPSQNPTHDYPTPPNVPNGYLYWNPTLGRWEVWEDLGGGGGLPRLRYNQDTGTWEPVYNR